MAVAMAGIPPVLESDAEDVAWALQTAEALWKRNERVDAIVWLRRAAQAAGEAEDDDRALVLARSAAELAEWLAANPAPAASQTVPPVRTPSNAPLAADAVDDLLRTSQTDEVSVVEEIRVSELPVESIPMESVHGDDLPPPPPPPALPPPPFPPRVSPPPPPARPLMETPTLADELPTGDRGTLVPTAAEKHAGMLDPWADHEAPTKGRDEHAEPSAPIPAFDPDEVVTSAPPMVRPPPKHSPPPLPPPPVPAPTPAPSPAPAPARAPAPAPTPAPAPAPSLPPATPPPPSLLNLSRVEALADLPDDARSAFARAATLTQLARDEEVSSFALALVVEGSVDVAATIVDAPARRLDAGAVLRARGTIDDVQAMRIIGASDTAQVATWDEAAVERAFRTCPWVEDDLRAGGNRLQAEVGITLGPLGERMDLALRTVVLTKLTLRALAEHEVFATRGEPIPGLLVVGAGELELLGEGDVLEATTLRPGDFLFPSEVLGAAPAPATARAAKGGALVLFADRGVAQELLVTCPPLLEIFAGG
jgi:hypothetical protein